MRRKMRVAMDVVDMAVGGALGAAVAGFAEAILVVSTAGAADEYWLFPYAVLSYGLTGLLMGLGLGVVLASATLFGGRNPTSGYAKGAAWSFFWVALVVARYHVAQRVYGEQLPTWTAEGLAVHAGLIGGAAVGAAILWSTARTIQRWRFAAASKGAVLLALLGLASVTAMVETPARPVIQRRSSGAKTVDHPNVILIVVDTLRADALGVYGAGSTASPAIDRFANQGVRFKDASAQSSWTRPSIATILTSLYPAAHGAIHKMDPLGEQVTTLAETFRSRGYWTAGFVSNINVAPIFNFQQGFEEYDYLAPSFYFGATDSATRLAIYKLLRVLRERLFSSRLYVYNYYQDAAVVNEAALAWLKQQPPQPFFLFLHYMDPHDPYFEIPYNGHGVARVTNPDPPHSQRDEMLRLYREEVAYLDTYLARLFEGLKERGVFEDSTIVLTADHGEEFLDHGGWWHGSTLYQEAVHVPLIVKRANEPQPGSVRIDPARSIDIAPTLTASAGLAAPGSFQGSDLFHSPQFEAAPLFAEEDLEGNQLFSLRVGDWKIVTANADNPRGLPLVELFDLSRDPSEHTNLAAVEEARVRTMLQQLDAARTANGRRPG